MFIEINCITKLSYCFKYWSGNAPGRSARSRPLAAARLGPIAPRTRADELELFQYVSIYFNMCHYVSIRSKQVMNHV